LLPDPINTVGIYTKMIRRSILKSTLYFLWKGITWEIKRCEMCCSGDGFRCSWSTHTCCASLWCTPL